MMTRRNAIKNVTLATAACATVLPALAQPATPRTAAAPAITGPFILPRLIPSYDAFEPYIDAQTMEIHYLRHHQAYITNLNKLVADHAELKNKSVEEMLRGLAALPEGIRAAVRNQGGGHYNHSFFWWMMRRDGGGEPKGELAAAIDKEFKSFAGFSAAFTTAATTHFGSGWAWLVLNAKKRLSIETSTNQDSPISTAGKNVVLGLDLWEHAYYLKYQNRRPDYIAAFFKVINWEFIDYQYDRLMKA